MKERNCVILNAIFWKKINFAHHHLVYTEIRKKQPLWNNFSLKIFHYFLKRTISTTYTVVGRCYPEHCGNLEVPAVQILSGGGERAFLYRRRRETIEFNLSNRVKLEYDIIFKMCFEKIDVNLIHYAVFKYFSFNMMYSNYDEG